MRADARRSRDAIISAASDLFAEGGSEVQMDEIAERAGLGTGTLYRHFATKQVLLAAIIGRRFAVMTELARAAARDEDPGTSFETLLVSYLEAAECDAAFRYAILGPEQTEWAEIAQQQAEVAEVAQTIILRAIHTGQVRPDLTFTDFVLITRGAMANMNPADNDWRRHLALMLEAIRGCGATSAIERR